MIEAPETNEYQSYKLKVTNSYNKWLGFFHKRKHLALIEIIIIWFKSIFKVQMWNKQVIAEIGDI